MWIYVLGAIVFGIILIYLLFVEDKNNTEQKNNNQEKNINDKSDESANIKKETSNNIEATKTENLQNVIAQKLTVIVFTIKVIGYLVAICVGIATIINVNLGYGLIIGVCIAVAVFFSTLIYEALAELINLLHEIKNKL